MDITNCLVQIMNAKRSGKDKCSLPSSKFLLEALDIMKKYGYIDYKAEKDIDEVVVGIKELNECRAIKPRFNVKLEKFDKYIKRFLPARDMGIIIVSTNKGLLTHQEAIERKIGGSLIAYCY